MATSREQTGLKKKKEQRTGQNVDVSVLAFVAGVIGAVGSEAHVHRARLHFLSTESDKNTLE